MYRVDLKTRKCNVTVPYRPFFQRGTFPGEKFEFEAVIGGAGLPNEQVTVQRFSMNTTGGRSKFRTTTVDGLLKTI